MNNLFTVFYLFALLAPACMAQQKNLLFICVDDLRSVLGCYGGQALTPNIDKIAKQGQLFQRHYTQYPVCGPSRNALLHGVRPDTTAMESMKINKNKYTMKSTYDYKARKGYPSLIGHVTDHGIKTAVVGKVAHGHSSYMKPSIPFERTGTWECWVNFDPKAHKKYRPAYEIFEGNEDRHSDVRGLQAALKNLDKLKNDRFMLTVGFWKPHLPFVAPKRIWDKYEGMDIQALGSQKKNRSAAPFTYTGSQEFYAYGDQDGNMYSDTHRPTKKEVLDMTRAYYSAITYTDEHIGKIIAKLEALGLRESTAIILWADHGFMLGDQDHWCKNAQFEANFNSPLLTQFSNVEKTGRIDALVETIDLFPTVCDFFDIPKPKTLEGKSLFPILNGDMGKQVAYSQCDRGFTAYSVKTDRYRYTEWRNPKKLGELGYVELFDHLKDPDETQSIASSPEWASVIREHRQLMSAGFKRLREANIDFSGDPALSQNKWIQKMIDEHRAR